MFLNGLEYTLIDLCEQANIFYYFSAALEYSTMDK